MIKVNLFTAGELTAFPVGFEVFKGPVCILPDFHLASGKIIVSPGVAVKCKMVMLKMKRHTEF